MTHELKTWPKAFEAMWLGLKRYELRKGDRPFGLGDTLRLKEWDPDTGQYSGREILAEVTYITRAGDFPGLEEGFVILGLGETVPLAG